MKKLYVGNLPFTSTEDDIKELFAEHGDVSSVKLITDRDTGRSRGYAFIELDDDAADKAIDALNGADVGGRNIKVNTARERQDRGGFRR